jgi:hypothetical protein
MPSVDDQLATGQTDFKAAAAAGVNVLDHMAEFTFDLYDRVVLPLDGYVFWVKRTPTVVATTQITVQGSLHIGTTNSQDEAANISQSRVTFTALRQVDSLISAAPSTMWIFTVPSGPMAGLKCAFSMQGNYYKQADLFHYVGFALFADNATQVIDDPATLPSALIVSNSLPIWLFLSSYAPSSPAYGFRNAFALYPSFLVPDNISPVSPYGAVDISSDGTEALQAAPLIDSTQSHYQLVHDQVRVTLYGGTNKQALDFVDCVNQYSLDYGTIGIMNVPVIRDAKRTQNEFNILGMKKIVSFDVSYYQDTVVSVARQLILKSVPSYVIT